MVKKEFYLIHIIRRVATKNVQAFFPACSFVIEYEPRMILKHFYASFFFFQIESYPIPSHPIPHSSLSYSLIFSQTSQTSQFSPTLPSLSKLAR